jgi:ketosteroid isomerase-like protein
MTNQYADFSALDPFFAVVHKGLAGFVDGDHYFDTLAEQAIFEFRYEVPGWPRRTEGRTALMDLYRGYGDRIVLERGDELIVHPCADGRRVVLEYDVHGRVLGSGAAYDNRFVSIVTIEQRKIVHWRDYMDSLAVMRSVSA